MEKRILPLLLIFALLLPGCAQSERSRYSQSPGTDMDAAEILQIMIYGTPEAESSYSRYDGEDALDYLEHSYGFQPEDLASAAVALAGGVSAIELAVIQLSKDADQDAAIQRLQQHLLDRQGDFTGYAPDQAALAKNGMVLSQGRWLALIISENIGSVAEAFSDCLDGTVSVSAASEPVTSLSNGRIAYVDPNIDDMTLYDTSAILSAWDDGDRSALSEKDAAILSAAEAVLNKVTVNSMSDYEKECAVYSWLTGTVVYDWDHYDPTVATDPDSYDPYGPLLNGKGVCLGYAAAFQLLMDLSGVECLTVVGAAFDSQEDHAWNMVRLNGEWYCVDATWDNYSGGQLEYCNYFNVTSDYMAETDHQWDYDSVPEATATDGGRG